MSPVLHVDHSRLKQVALAKLASFLAANDNPKLAALKEAFSSQDESGRLTGKVPYDKVRTPVMSSLTQAEGLAPRWQLHASSVLS